MSKYKYLIVSIIFLIIAFTWFYFSMIFRFQLVEISPAELLFESSNSSGSSTLFANPFVLMFGKLVIILIVYGYVLPIFGFIYYLYRHFKFSRN